MDSLALLLKNKPLDVFAASETWLKPQIPDCEVNISGYSCALCARQDRIGKAGGGTMIYVRDGIPYRRRLDLSGNGTESCVIEISGPNARNCLFGQYTVPLMSN